MVSRTLGGRISLSQAQRALEAYREIPPRFIDIELEDALMLTGELGIYAYDAYVIAAAEKQRCPLLSLDAELRAAAEQRRVDSLKIEP